jgi:hypothetical protein
LCHYILNSLWGSLDIFDYICVQHGFYFCAVK